jgi:PHP family Zn ribbon phosphoesterase
MALREFRADLHIHTSLSPCSDTWRMTPTAIVSRALEADLDLIAVCDHHSMRNVSAVQKAAQERDLVVLAGMEITSAEEVHALGIFGNLNAAFSLQETIDQNLMGENVAEVFGYQVIMDENDEILGSEDRFLAGTTMFTIGQVVDTIQNLGGVAVASHVDREAYGIFAQLGWIPEDLPLDGLEVSWRLTQVEARQRFPQIRTWPIIRGSDAHRPEEVGKVFTRLRMAEASFEELKLALHGERGREVIEGE